MEDYKKRWRDNALANLLGGAISVGFSLIVPAMMSRFLNEKDFHIWNIGMQVALYIQVIGIGIQTAVSRQIAQEGAASNRAMEIDVINSAFRVAFVMVMLCCIAVGIFVALGPVLFKIDQGELQKILRLSVFWIGLGSSIQIMYFVAAGLCVGKHLNIINVALQLFLKAVMVAGLYFLSKFCDGVLGFSEMYFFSVCVSVPLVFFLVKYFYPDFYWLHAAIDQKLKASGFGSGLVYVTGTEDSAPTRIDIAGSVANLNSMPDVKRQFDVRVYCVLSMCSGLLPLLLCVCVCVCSLS